MREDTLSYHLLCVNAPMAVDTNLFLLQPGWQSSSPYTNGSLAYYNWTYWRSIRDNINSAPGPYSSFWIETPSFPIKLAASQRELRLTFLWPQLPNGNV